MSNGIDRQRSVFVARMRALALTFPPCVKGAGGVVRRTCASPVCSQVQQEPKDPEYRSQLARSYRRRGLARGDLGDPAGASADARRAIALLEGMSSRTGEAWFDTACARAALVGLAGRAGSGASAEEAVIVADAAMTLFRKAIEMGYRAIYTYRAEDVLDSLRGRDDFRMLMMDLALPAEPFAPETHGHR
jgi:eukaryotic-like serine/threonine-protein kinase